MAPEITPDNKTVESRPCGECTLCCRLIGIDKCNEGGDADFPFDKPADTNCKHCVAGRGCQIFSTPGLPKLCHTYSCLWKDSRFLPEAWRPDRVNAICSVEGYIQKRLVIRVIVDRRAPLNQQFSSWVDFCVADGFVFVLQSGESTAVISQTPEVSRAVENALRSGRDVSY